MSSFRKIFLVLLVTLFSCHFAHALNCTASIRDGYLFGDDLDYIAIETEGMAISSTGTVYTVSTVYDEDHHDEGYDRILVRRGIQSHHFANVMFTDEAIDYHSAEVIVDHQDNVYILASYWDEDTDLELHDFWVSDDEGATWSELPTPPVPSIERLLVGPNGKFYFAGLTEDWSAVVYSSDDLGRSWQQLYRSSDKVQTSSVQMKISGTTMAVVHNGSGGFMAAISNDMGDSWQTHSGLDHKPVPVIVDSGEILFMSAEDTGGAVYLRKLRVDRIVDGSLETMYRYIPLGYYFIEDAFLANDGFIYSIGRGVDDGMAIQKSSLDFGYTNYVEDIYNGISLGGESVIMADSKQGFWALGVDHYDGMLTLSYYPSGCID